MVERIKSMVEKTITDVYFGYLVGQVREVLEASIQDERQLKALKGVMDDRLYEWWDKAVTPEGNTVLDPGNPRENREEK
jgi:hypothetical protein